MTAPVISGFGLTDVGKIYGRNATSFAAEAILLAVQDAGLQLPDVDGLLVSAGKSLGVDLSLAESLGLSDLSLLAQVQSFGATAGVMVQQAAQAVMSGQASRVVCVFADAPLKEGVSSAKAYRRPAASGHFGHLMASGITNPTASYALAARRHMETYGTTVNHLGSVAVSQRAWAADNPVAQFRDELTLEDHRESRMVIEPLRLLDCCLVSNGGAAVVVTKADLAVDAPHPPAHLWGWGQGHPGYAWERGSEFGLVTGAVQSGRSAMRMAGITPADVSIRELYDCYTYTTIVTLEDYGFCEKGEGGPLAASGALAPGGSLPTNTGGGQLSSFYLWGMTPLIEALVQARGAGGARQVEDNDVILVSGNGGILQYHSTLVLSPHAKEPR